MGCVVKSASGLSLMAGDTVYDENGKSFVVLKTGEAAAVTVYSGVDSKRYEMYPDELFHFKPDRCSDDKVLKSGQIVWPLLRDDGPFVVEVVIEGFVSCYKLTDPNVVIHISPDGLSHSETVVDARGARIDKGDTVYSLVRGIEYEVLEVSRSDNSLTLRNKLTDEKVHAGANRVTHVFPDSWAHIESDAEKSPCDYFDTDRRCRYCPQWGDDCQKSMRVDLVMRCKRLAERDAGR